uniref:Uncharacterized protein n=1 Tax=Oryza punctata TaxID=4537 RepID=A0A0E0K1G3_ORYPU
MPSGSRPCPAGAAPPATGPLPAWSAGTERLPPLLAVASNRHQVGNPTRRLQPASTKLATWFKFWSYNN